MSKLISFASDIISRPNLHLPLLRPDPGHLTSQVLGHQTNTAAQIIKLSPTTTWTPLAISSDYFSYYTALHWDIFMFFV